MGSLCRSSRGVQGPAATANRALRAAGVETAARRVRAQRGVSTPASTGQYFAAAGPLNSQEQCIHFGEEPHFSLPALDQAVADQPLVLDAQVRFDEDVASAVALLQSGAPRNDDAVALLNSQLEAAIANRDRELTRVQQLSAEIRNLQAERVAVASDYRWVHAVNEALVSEVAALRDRLESSQAQWRSRLESSEAQWRSEREALKAELNVVYHLRSWWLTAPLRRLFRAIS